MKRGTRRLAAALLSLVLFALAGCAPKALPEASAPAEAAGAALYARRDHAVYGDTPILVGIELETGFVHCEGSDELQEELFLYQGLSEAEWENPFLAWRMLTRCSR